MASEESIEKNEVLSIGPWAEFLGVESPDSLSYEAFKQESDTTKLHSEDMALYGFCPAFDEVYLVICNYCQKVFKPPSFKSHIERRHSAELPQSKEESAAISLDNSNENVPSTHGMLYNKTVPFGAKSLTARQNEKSISHGSQIQSTTSENIASNIKVKSGSRSKKPLVLVKKIDSSMTLASDGSAARASDEKTSVPQMSSVLPTVSRNLLSSTSGPGPGESIVVRSSVLSSSRTSPLEEHSSVNVSNSKTANEVRNMSELINKKSAVIYGIKRGPPCRSREYDHDKHCGVVIPETGKPCTRAITSCSVHPISLRRRVPGRTRPCDELIKKQKEHRALKRTSVQSSAQSESPPSKFPSLVNQRLDQILPNSSNIIKNRQSPNSPFVKSESSLNLLHTASEQVIQSSLCEGEQDSKEIDSDKISNCGQTINCFALNSEMSLHADMNQPLKSLLPKHECSEEQQGKMPPKDQFINYLLTDQQPVKLVLLQSDQHSEANQPIEYTFPNQSISSVQSDSHLFNYVISNSAASSVVQTTNYINAVLPSNPINVQENQPLNFVKSKSVDELQFNCTIANPTPSFSVSNDYILSCSEKQGQPASYTVVSDSLSDDARHENQTNCTSSGEQYFYYSIDREQSLNSVQYSPSVNPVTSSQLSSESLKCSQQNQPLNYFRSSDNFEKEIPQDELPNTVVLPQQELFHFLSGEKVLTSGTEEQEQKSVSFAEPQSLITNEEHCLSALYLDANAALLTKKQAMEPAYQRNVIKDSDNRILNLNSLSEQQISNCPAQPVEDASSYTTVVPDSELKFSLGTISSKNLQNCQLYAQGLMQQKEIGTNVSSIPSNRDYSPQTVTVSSASYLDPSVSKIDTLPEQKKDKSTRPACIPLILRRKSSAVTLRKSKQRLPLQNHHSDPFQNALIKATNEEKLHCLQEQQKNFKEVRASEASNEAYSANSKLVSSKNTFLLVNNDERSTGEIIFDKAVQRPYLTNDPQASVNLVASTIAGNCHFTATLTTNVSCGVQNETDCHKLNEWKNYPDSSSESNSTVISVENNLSEPQGRNLQISTPKNNNDSSHELASEIDPCNTTSFSSPLSNHMLATQLSIGSFSIPQNDLMPVVINF